MIKSKNVSGKDVIYANSGTWIEHEANAPTRTYVVVERKGSATTVGLYQYSADGSSTLLKDAQLVED